MKDGNDLTAIILSILGSSTLNGVITHILYKSKLKKDIILRRGNIVQEKISDALIEFRDLELEATTIEVYDIDQMLKSDDGNIDFFNGTPIYPAFMNDRESLLEFWNKIHSVRKNSEKYLNCYTALNLVFIDRYIAHLIEFSNLIGKRDIFPLLGTVIIFDIQSWQKKLDKYLVKQINKGSYKVESHCSKKWNKMRDKELTKQWESTLLHYLVSGQTINKKLKKTNLILIIAKMIDDFEDKPMEDETCNKIDVE